MNSPVNDFVSQDLPFFNDSDSDQTLKIQLPDQSAPFFLISESQFKSLINDKPIKTKLTN